MSSEEFSWIGLTLLSKYNTEIYSKGFLGNHWVQVGLKQENYPDTKISYSRPYTYSDGKTYEHTQLKLRFAGGAIATIQKQLAKYQDIKMQNNFESYISFFDTERSDVFFTNDPAYLQDSLNALEIVYSHNLISPNIYRFLKYELGE